MWTIGRLLPVRKGPWGSHVPRPSKFNLASLTKFWHAHGRKLFAGAGDDLAGTWQQPGFVMKSVFKGVREGMCFVWDAFAFLAFNVLFIKQSWPNR
jgi:hypothetical protein